MEAFPQALALGAWLEGSHTMRIARNGEQVTVILSHERGVPGWPDFTPLHQAGSTLHRHGAAARMLCVFVSRQSRQADHVASFAAGSVCENSTRVIETKASSAELAAADLTAMVSAEASCAPTAAFPKADFSRPRSLDSLRLLRSTVLII